MKTTIAIIASLVLTYAAFAFVTLHLNPINWTSEGRFAFVGFSVWGSFAIFCALEEMKKGGEI